MNPTLPIPRLPMPKVKKPSLYMTRAEVVKLCRENHLGEASAKTLFFGADSAARKVLPGRTYAVYVRRVVFDVLGLSDE